MEIPRTLMFSDVNMQSFEEILIEYQESEKVLIFASCEKHLNSTKNTHNDAKQAS
jgi:hypothetical protein